MRSAQRAVAVAAAAVAALGALAGAAPAAGQADGPPTQVVAVVDGGSTTVVEVTEAELEALQEDPAVDAVVRRGGTAQTEIAQSVPFIGAPGVWATGERGAGQVIVVIDTGVADTFGGTLVGQACFAANANGTVGYCGPDGGELSAFDSTCFSLGVCTGGTHVLDPAAGRPCEAPAQPKDCAHGTAVAAVAARQDPPAGVAPDAGVYAIRVFNPTGSSADLVDILLALDHARRLADAGLPVAAVNLSVSTSSTFVGSCDSTGAYGEEGRAYKGVLDQLRVRGIPTAVSSGNDGRSSSMGFPACVSSTVSVGASDLDDDLADFSNRGAGLDLVAPGAREGNGALQRLVVPGGPVTSWAGTSFSAPHVAGAFALLDRTYPKASVDQLTRLLQDSAVGITDPATGASYRRPRLGSPAAMLRGQVLFPDEAPISGAPQALVGDFDGDIRADVLGYAPGGAPDRASFGTAGWSVTNRTYSVNGSYQPLVGSFRGAADGPDDILWYAPGPAGDHLWTGNPSRSFSSAPLTVNGTYEPQVGDFDGDGWDDVFWYAPGPGSDWLWYGGSSGFTSIGTSVQGTYRIAVGDVDGDDRDDLVFHGPNAAPDFLWRARSTRGSFISSSLPMGGDYTILVGDLNGDDADDLLLYQPGGRSDAIWRGGPGVGGPGGAGGFSPLSIQVNGTYHPAVGDVDGDGRDDVLWYAPGGAGDYLWMGEPVGTPTSRSITVNGTYTPLLVDLDADDGDEIVWFRGSGSSAPLWWSHAP